MARAFHVRRETRRDVNERVYLLHGDKLILLQNRGVRLPLGPTDEPKNIVEQYETTTWKSKDQEIGISEIQLEVGTFFKSIARPTDVQKRSPYNPLAQSENEAAKKYKREHDAIARDIELCFDVASPSLVNYETFGIQFEKIIYFCCVGVEGLFKKILSDNCIPTKGAGTDTFVKLKPWLRIDEYKLSLVRYPWLPTLSPFAEWDAEQPSQSLGWFDTYNALKHDKQNNLHRATLRNALEAAAGYYALTYAVFGSQMFYGFFSEQFFLDFSARPRWQIDELYFKPFDDQQWQARNITL